jgi:hypothetical protein
MTRSHLIGALAALLVAAAALGWWRTYEWKEQPQRMPLRGEARINPLYGLQQVLDARGHEVTSATQLRVGKLPPESTLLVLDTDLRVLPRHTSNELLGWVAAGNQLLVGLPTASGQGSPALLDALGFGLEPGFDCIEWKYKAPPYARKAAKRTSGDSILDAFADPEAFQQRWLAGNRFCSQQRLLPTAPRRALDFSYSYGNSKQGYVFARLPYGEGAITFASHLRFLRTEALRTPANAALTWQLLAPALESSEQVLLIHATDLPPLHVLVLRHGWPILLPLLLALLAWLWQRSQRFGPLRPLPPPARRALRERLRASAEHALRGRAGAQLLRPLRQRLHQRLSLHAPALAALPGSALAAELARRYGLPAAAVDRALFDNDIRRAPALAEAVRLLHRLSEEP